MNEPTAKPNILYILADDLGWGDIGRHGAPIRTPQIDRLAAEGVELTQHYVCPVCTPTRVSLLSGRHPGRFGPHATIPTNHPVFRDGSMTLASLLREAGYDTGLFGKWHLGSDPRFYPGNFGFNHSYGSLAGGVDPYLHRYKEGPYSVTWHRNGRLREDTGHVTDLIVQEAVEWIESRDRPWFCYVPFTAVHTPIKPTREWLARYYPDRFDEDPLKDWSFKQYAAYTSHMDEAVGQLLESLERMCARENTLVVFASDNGALHEDHTDVLKYPGWQETYPRLGSNLPFRGNKNQLYEGGVRTPTIVSWRGRLNPGTMDHPVQMVDWMPTLSALTGAEPEEDPCYDGRNIWSLIAGTEDAPDERSLFWTARRGREYALRRGNWKLIHRTATEQNELFDIKNDPGESIDLADEHPDVVRDLATLMQDERMTDGVAVRPDMADRS